MDLCDRLDITATRPGRAAEERVRVFPQAPERGGGDFCETNQTGDGPAVWPAGPGAADHRLWHCLFHPGRAGDLPHFQPALCGQPAHPPERGDGHHLPAWGADPAAAPNPAPAVRPCPAAAAAGGPGLWVPHRPGGLGDPGHPGALLWGAVAAVPGGGVPGGRRGGPGSGGRGGDPGRGGVRAGGVPGDPLSLWEPEGGL